MTRSANSIAAYHAIKANGVLSQQQWAVYHAVWHSSIPLSGNDLDRALGKDAHKRVSELVDGRVLVEADRVVDPNTGMLNSRYTVTEHVPAEKIRPRKRAKRPPATTMRLAAARVRSLLFITKAQLDPGLDQTLRWLEDR